MVFALFFWKVLGSEEKNVIVIKKLTMKGLNKMGVMKIENFTEDYITTELINTGSCPRIMFLIVKFVFSSIIQALMAELDSEFDSKGGRPAYPYSLNRQDWKETI